MGDYTSLAEACQRLRGFRYRATLSSAFRRYGGTNDWLDWLTGALRLGVEDRGLQANVLRAIGDVQQFRKENDAALASYNDALKLFRAVGAKLGEANVYLSLGGIKRGAEDVAGARLDFEAALKIF